MQNGVLREDKFVSRTRLHNQKISILQAKRALPTLPTGKVVTDYFTLL